MGRGNFALRRSPCFWPAHSPAAFLSTSQSPRKPLQLSISPCSALPTCTGKYRTHRLLHESKAEAQLGLAKVATLIQRVRAERPNVLLFDSGDTIQGTPLAYFAAREDADKTNPMVLAMNALRYDAAAAGNHEIQFWARCAMESERRSTLSDPRGKYQTDVW